MVLKTGDVLEFAGDELEPLVHIMEVRAVVDTVVFVRNVYKASVGPTEYMELETIITYGWKLRD